MVCLAPQLFLPVYLHTNVGLSALPAATSPTPPVPVLLGVLSIRLSISAPPSGLDECSFFNFLIVGLPYSSIFCQFWLFFVFKICCCPSFGCVRRQRVSTYASILAGITEFFKD